MSGFKKYYGYLMIVAAAAIVSGVAGGCNIAGGNSSSSSKTAENSISENFKPTVIKPGAGGQTENNGGRRLAGERSRAGKSIEKRILLDGSEYVAMRDAYGNKIEYRYFEPETGVKYISLQTLTDGSTTLEVRTWDGFVKQLNSSQLKDPWRVTAREIALLTGFPLDYQLAETPSPPRPLNPIVALPEESIVSKHLEQTPAKAAEIQNGESQPEQILQPPAAAQPPQRSATPDQSAALRRMLNGSRVN